MLADIIREELKPVTARLDRIEATQADHGRRLGALTDEVETLGRDVRQQHAELLAELPGACAAAAVRAVQPDVAELRAAVNQLDRRVTELERSR